MCKRDSHGARAVSPGQTRGIRLSRDSPPVPDGTCRVCHRSTSGPESTCQSAPAALSYPTVFCSAPGAGPANRILAGPPLLPGWNPKLCVIVFTPTTSTRRGNPTPKRPTVLSSSSAR
ncbi:hypothetical protein SORBI_3003G061850 [Sorghum bicolor]|uniref:Uncharacterized protein n=1 Tax=Sorghum bicolor TaxID=4558 RepID=A0A1W0VVZ3_SORBI|nr:hypothetical protein SORBI_3003G061850 [Sorghum bicolor]